MKLFMYVARALKDYDKGDFLCFYLLQEKVGRLETLQFIASYVGDSNKYNYCVMRTFCNFSWESKKSEFLDLKFWDV